MIKETIFNVDDTLYDHHNDHIYKVRSIKRFYIDVYIVDEYDARTKESVYQGKILTERELVERCMV